MAKAEEKCKARVPDSTGFHFYQCGNRARYGEFCGVHSQEKQKERAKKRGPTQWERECAAREKERGRIRREARAEAFEEVAGWHREQMNGFEDPSPCRRLQEINSIYWGKMAHIERNS